MLFFNVVIFFLIVVIVGLEICEYICLEDVKLNNFLILFVLLYLYVIFWYIGNVIGFLFWGL